MLQKEKRKIINFTPMRIEVYEKYSSGCEYTEEWWEENMPAGAIRPETKSAYRRTYIELEMIERPIEIPGNKGELILRMWTGEEMTIKENYDRFCITLHDFEEMEDEDDAT